MVSKVRVVMNWDPKVAYNKGRDNDRAVVIDLGDNDRAVVSPDQARQIAAKLVEVSDVFDRLYDEANTTKFPTKEGAVIKYEGSVPFMRKRNGDWIIPGGNNFTDEYLSDVWGTDFTVLYEGLGE